MRPNKNQNNVILKIVRAPYRALCRARDLYVKSMGSCASSVGHGNVGGPGGHYDSLPRSFSVGSSRLEGNDDFMELLRAASMKSLGNDPLDVLLKELKAEKPAAVKMNKSCSVGMGRIDEDRECEEFGEEGSNREVDQLKPGGKANLYTRRSRSYADAGSRERAIF